MTLDFASYLVSKEVIAADSIEEIERFRKTVSGSVADAALKLGLARPEDLARASSEFFQLPLIGTKADPLPHPDQVRTTLETLELSTEWVSAKRSLCWMLQEHSTENQQCLNVALNDPGNIAMLEEIRQEMQPAFVD